MTGPDLVVCVQAHCRDCPWISVPCRSQAEALAAHAAHERQAHAELWGARR